MFNFYKKLFTLSLLLLFFFIMPLTGGFLLADNRPLPNANPNGLVPCGKGAAGPADCTLNSLILLVNNVLGFAFWVASIIAAGLIIYAGGKMVYYASSSPNEARKAKSILWNIVIGYAIMLIAWVVVKNLVGFFASSTGPLQEAIKRVFN